ncbi:serine/threonine-protein kinase [Paucibacter sp. R3-3]|uniref:Serine/threonine-protein kinase n=1 Tax=Roseateles agri TaxID=3098619 RepID=A0ABU5DRD9_9BURK|nr:serine/threonine-protein kinase [Paucibacter sp. R3-3]MDY0748883.1 serine/threonine-protein kinase [Paucibacter sp. R3-3]
MTAPNFPIRAEDWPEVSRLFDEAGELAPEARTAFLARLDAEQPGLSVQVRALLASSAERETGDWLERGPRLTGEAWMGDGPRAGDTVGRYRLVDRCGSGGMGEVWQAEALEGPVRRVALKLPLWHRPGSATAERFAREGDILAALDHPHIARLFDAGTAADGTPYLAMEWVEGEPLIAWCDSRRLGLAERLALFQQVLEAVAYAHAHLVLHRDLKPAHLLVTPQGQVKLLDFGIAKLLDDGNSPADATELTRAAGRMMTTAYAAPEQVRGSPLTTAADLYSLGVVLFELLSGHRPYAPRLNTPAQLETAIAEGHLMRAADAATDVDAQARGLTRRALVKQLRGDLDAVLDKALQLEPARRYASAEALSADLARHLRGHPVLAAPTSRWQRAWKFTQRHRAGVALGTLAVCSLVGVTATALWQAHEARAQRAKAEASLATTESFAFFLGDLLGDALAAGGNESSEAVVGRAERIARGEFADEPETLSRVLLAIAQHHGGIGESERAAKLYEEARALTHEHSQQQAIDCDLGMMYQRIGRRDEALAMLQRVADDPNAEAVSRANCASYQATVLFNAGKLDDALRAADAATAYWRAMPRPIKQFEAPLLGLKASILMNTPRVAEADPLFARAIQSMKELGRDQGPNYVALLNNWALGNFLAGQLGAAQTRHDEALAQARAFAGPQGVAPINLLNAAADRLELGLYPEALALYDQTLAAARSWHNAGFAASAQCMGALALLRGEPGHEAEAQARLAAGRAEKLSDSPADRIAATNCIGAEAQLALARGDAAAALKGFDTLLAVPKMREAARALLLQWRSRAQLAVGNAEAARVDAEASLKLARQLQGTQPASFRTALALDALARAQGDAAGKLRQEADAALAASVAPTHWLRR